MTLNDPLTRADEWLYTLLAADPALQGFLGGATNPRIYSAVEPQGNKTYPIVIWQWQASGPDVRPNGTGFIYANLLYLIKAIDKTDTYPRAIMDRVTTLLDNKTGAATGGNVIFCQRETPWRMTEIDPSGVVFSHTGAQFRIWVQ